MTTSASSRRSALILPRSAMPSPKRSTSTTASDLSGKQNGSGICGSAGPIDCADLPGVKILNSEDPEQSCGIGFISVQNIDPAKLNAYLWEKFRIWTTVIDTPGEYSGLRITPNVYTTLEEIDTFSEAMENVIRKGLPTA